MRCFQLLGLPGQPTPSVDAVKQAWRLAASRHHPDRGGDPATFDQLRRAYVEALEEALRPRPCAECGGKGRIQHLSGWVKAELLCDRCGGTGEEP